MFTPYNCRKMTCKYLLYLFLIIPLTVTGETIHISAEYKPESYDANGGRFINTTVCDIDFEIEYCDPKKPFEASTVIKLPVSISRIPNSNDGRNNYLGYYRTLGPRNITLTSVDNNHRYELKVIPTHIGARLSNMHIPVVNVNDRFIFYYPSGNCLAAFPVWASWLSSIITGQAFLYEINRRTQGGIAECYVNNSKGDNLSYTIDSVNYGFRLEAPDPLKMPNGVYKGNLKIRIGNGQDIDLGKATYSGGTEHSLEFTLTVRHQLKVDFPPGGDKVVLLPPGGWSDWVYRGKNRVPPSLRADLHYRMWFSSKIKIILNCEYPNGDECFIKNTNDGHLVPIHVYWQDTTLITTTTAGFLFVPSSDGRPAVNANRFFSFKITDTQKLKEMMQRSGGTYKGKVTIIFDATI